ncbi:MAG: choice-of-anchor L domain-containing protein [Chitinophagales bacterium]
MNKTTTLYLYLLLLLLSFNVNFASAFVSPLMSDNSLNSREFVMSPIPSSPPPQIQINSWAANHTVLKSWQPIPKPKGQFLMFPPSCIEADSLELVAFYNATGGDDWTDNSGWLVDDVSEWFGVTLSVDGCGVAELNMFIDINTGNNLVGNIYDFNLSNLEILNLKINQLTGEIPNFNLPSLEVLWLGRNTLTGDIPNFDLPNLKVLSLDFNALTGEIPNFDLPNLEALALYDNALTGEIPNFDLPNLEYLGLQYNLLTGEIPNFDFPNLETLYSYDNALTGEIPNFNLPNLERLGLSDNALTGEIPNFDLPNLNYLVLSDNELTFAGLVPHVQNYNTNSNFTTLFYAPQATIPLLLSNNTLYVEVGGNLSNNHYTWYKDGIEIPNMPVDGDSSWVVTESGNYYVEVTNDSITNPSISVQNLVLVSDELFVQVNSPNDNCLDATSLDPLMVAVYGSYSNVGATIEGSDLLPDCFNDNTLDNTVWFTFTGDGNAYNISTTDCSASSTAMSNTQMAIFEGGNCNSLSEVDCSEDIEVGTDLFSAITLPTTNGTEYYLMVDGNGGNSGDFCLDVSLVETCSSDLGGTIWVTTTDDNGDDDNPTVGSLRAAIKCANETEGANDIHFNLTGTAPFVFQPTIEYPSLIDSSTIIDATTQSNFSLGDVELDGSMLDLVNGLEILGNDCSIYGLYIHSFPSYGIFVEESNNVQIGGDESEHHGNVISNNGTQTSESSSFGGGLRIVDCENVTIYNNKIGTDVNGLTGFGNISSGITITNGSNFFIGGSGDNQGNIISNNLSYGIWGNLNDSDIQGNKIGTDISGTIDLGNGLEGININGVNLSIGGSNINEGNLISGNDQGGIRIVNFSENITITGNLIGVNINGDEPLNNDGAGILIFWGNNILIGGNTNLASNILNDPISLDGGDNITVQGNKMGVDIQGEALLGNSQTHGIGVSPGAQNVLIGGNNSSQANIIGGHTTAGIILFIDGTTGDFPSDIEMKGNFIGTDITSTIDLGNNIGISGHLQNNNNIIGGLLEGEGNTIAFNNTAIRFYENGTGIEMRQNNIFCNNKTYDFSELIDVSNIPNPPIIVEATTTTLTGTAEVGATIEIFVQDHTLCSGNTTCQGNYLATVMVDASTGEWSYEGAFTIGDIITTTATNSSNNTSEFSACSQICPKINPVIAGETFFCEGETITLTANDFSDFTAKYIWSTGETEQGISINTGGTYTVTVTDGGICSGTASIEVIQNSNPFAEILAGDEVFCSGTGLDIFVQIPSNSTSVWSNGDEAQITTIELGGIYTVTVTNENNCSTTSSVFIEELPQPNPEIVGDFNFCEGKNTILSLTEVYVDYLWSNGSIDSNIEVSENGVYTVSVSDGNICVGIASVEVVANEIPTLIISSSNGTLLCTGDTLSLTANSNATDVEYIWSNGTSGQEIEITEGGDYTVTVKDSNGCSNIASITIDTSPSPSPSIDGELGFCEGGNTVLSTGNAYSSYLWSTGEQGFSIEVTEAGDYGLTVTNANGCSGQKEVSVIENELPVVFIEGESTLCDPSILLNVEPSNEDFTYQWSTDVGATSQEIIVNTIGTYTVTVTDFNGCSATDEHQVDVCIEGCDVVADFILQDTICTSVALTIEELLTESTTTGGEWQQTYLDGTPVVVTDDFLIFPEVGTYTITYFVESPSDPNCNDTDTKIIYAGEPDFPSWSTEGDNYEICETNLPIAVFPDNEGGYWCCGDFGNCKATDESCFTIIDGQMYFDPIGNSSAVESYDLYHITTFEKCSSTIKKELSIYAQPAPPEVNPSTITLCENEILDVFIFMTAPFQYSDQLFTFNVYNENDELLIEGISPNDDMVDLSNLLTSIGTYTFLVRSVNGTCESEAVEVSIFVEGCQDCPDELFIFSATCLDEFGQSTITIFPIDTDDNYTVTAGGIELGENVFEFQSGSDVTVMLTSITTDCSSSALIEIPTDVPVLQLNNEASQVTICGAGDIILAPMGAGEGATYNYYLDPNAIIPATPASGSVWVNSEIVGQRIIYIIATTAEGCESAPLAVSTYSYENIAVSNITTLCNESDNSYTVFFTISGGNGVYTVDGASAPDNFTSAPIAQGTGYSFVIDDDSSLPSCEPLTLSGLSPDCTDGISAVDDFASTETGESVIIDILENDSGCNLSIGGIVVAPSCGEITTINPETGEVTYLADTDTQCTEDTFVYEVIDCNGATDEATVTIFISQETALAVEVIRNCEGAEETGTYELEVIITGGAPPFTISGSINEVLPNYGNTFAIISDTESYTINVVDANGDEFYREGGKIPCVKFAPCLDSIAINGNFCPTENPTVTLIAVTIPSSFDFSYEWSTGENTQTIEVSEVGFYSVTVLNTDGCGGMDSVEIIEDCPQDCEPLIFTDSNTQLNGNAQANTENANCWTLTDESTSGQAGSIWSQQKVLLNEPFVLTAFLSTNLDGSDGFTFTLHNDDSALTALGSNGEGLGYGPNLTDAVTATIQPSIAVELDTHENPTLDSEPTFNHIAVNENGNMESVTTPIEISSFENGQSHELKVVWNPTTFELIYYFDGEIKGIYEKDIVTEIFGSENSIYWGFTAATGNSVNTHQICDVQMTNCATELTAIDDTYTTCSNTSFTFNPVENDLGDCIEITGLIVSGNDITLEQIDNDITYTPTTDFAGTIDFEYIITDCFGQMDTALVTIVVLDTTPIEAVNDTVYIFNTQDSPSFTFNILENDIGENIILIADSFNPPTSIGDFPEVSEFGEINFIPAPSIEGTFTIEYEIQGQCDQIDIATVTLIITEESIPNSNADELVDIILDDCISFQNAVINCADVAIAQFDTTITEGIYNNPFTKGIALTTGSVELGLYSPNTSGSAGLSNGASGDADLETEQFQTFNACALEFDFTANTESISFRYWFGSEEYPEWVNTQFSDRMGIFINGTGFDSLTNIALVPDTTIPVGVDGINHLNNTSYFVENEANALPQYDGFTIPLEAITNNLTIGETYHIKIVIADVNDAIYDSGLFIEANTESNDFELIVSEDTTINAGESTQLSAEVLNTTAEVTYTWTPTETLDNPNIANPIASPTETTTYSVTATIGGCEKTNTVTVTVNSIPCEGLSVGILPSIDPYVCFGENIGGTTSIIAEGFTLREGDVLGYVLQDENGNILAYRTEDANFIFEEIEDGQYNTEYFVLAIAGTDNGSGEVDLTGECVDKSNLFPVVFLEKINVSTAIVCENNEQFIEVTLEGGLPAYSDSETYELIGYESLIVEGETVRIGPFEGMEILEVLDGNGCSVSTEVNLYQLTISLDNLEGEDVTNNTIILDVGDARQLWGNVNNSENPSINYTWSPIAGFGQLLNINATEPDTITHTLTVDIDDFCSLQAEVTVIILPTAYDCLDAIVPCNNEPIVYNSNGKGEEEILGTDKVGCLVEGEHYSTWIRLQIDNTTSDGEHLTFTITPNDGQRDYDFNLYKADDCNDLEGITRCSFAPTSMESASTGLNEVDTDDEDTDNGFARYVAVTGGEIYYLLIDNFGGNAQGFTLEWTNPNVFFNCDTIPECYADAGTASSPKDTYCSTESYIISVEGEYEGEDFNQAYFFLDEDSNIVSQPNSQTSGTYYFAYLNSQEIIDFNEYNTLADIGTAILEGACMDTSNIASFEIIASPPKPTFTSISCDQEAFYIEVEESDAIIRWYSNVALNDMIGEGNPFPVTEAGTYYVTQTLNSCESEAQEVVVTEADFVCLGECPENLVQNFSFEERVGCPSVSGQIERSAFWSFVPGITNAPDYFNNCNATTNNYETPQNIVGTQIPFEGTAYAGLMAYNQANNTLINREYIQTELTAPLIEGQSYCVSMQVSLAENSQFAIDNLGLYFSGNQITSNSIEGFLEPQIVHQGFLEDTDEWMEVKGTFTATAGLQYLSIGNFALNNGVKEVNSDGNGEAYYYIDMIEIRPTNEIGSLSVFDMDNNQLNTESNTIVICEGETICLDAEVTNTNFTCSFAWADSTNVVQQFSYCDTPTKDTTVYSFWVSNGLCEVEDSLVVIFGEEMEEGEPCTLSICPQIEELMANLNTLSLTVPFERSKKEVSWEELVQDEIDLIAEAIGIEKSKIGEAQISFFSLNSDCNPDYYQIIGNQVIYNNSDSCYIYMGQDELTYTLSFPSCGTVTRSVKIELLCPKFEVQGLDSDCLTASFQLSDLSMSISSQNTLNHSEISALGWSAEWKIEELDDVWRDEDSAPIFLEPNTDYIVLVRMVKADTQPLTPIFHGSYAETCGASITTPPLDGMPVSIIERCLEDGGVELTAIVESSDAIDDFVMEWSTGETIRQIIVYPPFDENYWVNILRISDGCIGIDSVSDIGPPDVFVEYTDASRCVATIGVRNTIPQSITCHKQPIPEEDCWWNPTEQAYKCEINLLETTSDTTYVVVNDFKGCENSVKLFRCQPDIRVIKPNPSKRLFTIELTGIPIKTPIHYYVYSIDGRMVMDSENMRDSGSQPLENWRTLNIDLDERFVSGMYFVQFFVEGVSEPLVAKLLKQE